MSIYNYELVRLNGDIKVFVGIQNDWSGQITEGIRNIFLKDNTYYFRADGTTVNVNTMREDFLRREDQIKTALEWYQKTKF